ncbi:hypothetical protein PIB30_087295, partial [Stylosanthes scabra]|nr:hypothetical protein [Stylosanthes scabra]
MVNWFNVWIVVALLVPVLLSLRNPRRESQSKIQNQIQTQSIPHSQKQTQTLHLPSSSSSPSSNSFFNERIRDGSNLDYDFYRDTCPQAEDTIRSAVTRIFFDRRDSAPAILRLFFHDCFIQGCDASLLLDDSNGDKNHSIEKQAVPNQTLRGFDKIDLIKEEVEQACPGVVSCADILAIAARDFVTLAGGPFYPVLTGRRDSNQS